MAFPPNFDRVWDETFPPDTQAANLLGQDIRNFKIDIRERISLISGTLANRPTPDASWGGVGFGMLYFATDTSVIYQWNGAAWVQAVFSNLVASVDLPNQNTNLGPTVFFTAVNAGIFELDHNLVCSLSGAGSAALTISWNNGLRANATIINTLNFGNTLGNELPAQPVSFRLGAGQSVSYTIGYNAPGSFDLRLRLKSLG
jgi:hypothetical protein